MAGEDFIETTEVASIGPQEDQYIDTAPEITTVRTRPIVTPAVAEEKAQRTDYALGKYSPGAQAIYDATISGTESTAREYTSAQERLDLRNKQLELVDRFVEYKRQSGSPITQEDITAIKNLSIDEVAKATNNPSTYFENKFADRWVKDTTSPDLFEEAQRVDPQKANEIMLRTSKHIAIVDGLRDLASKVEEDYKDSGYLQRGVETAFMFIPFVSDIARRKGIGNESWSSGENTKMFIEKMLMSKTPEEALDMAATAIEDIKQVSLTEARNFANALLDYSSQDETIDNVFQGLDIASVVPLGLLARGAKTTAKIAAKPFKRSNIPGAQGNVLDEALQKTINRVDAKANQSIGSDRVDNLRTEAQNLHNPGSVFQDVGSFTPEVVQRLQNVLKWNSSRLMDGVLNEAVATGRLEGSALNVARAEAERLFHLNYPGLNDAVIAVRPISSAETLGNVDMIGIRLAKFGTGELFDTPQQAEISAKFLYGLKDYSIKQEGSKFFVEVQRAVDETSETVRDALRIQTTNQTPQSMWNTFMGVIRSKDYQLPEGILRKAKSSTVGASGLVSRMQEVAREIGSLSRREQGQLDDFFILQRDSTNPATGRRGVFSRTLGEFEQDFLALHGSRPSEKQARAYFSYTQLNDLDWTIRNLGIYRDKVRQGLNMFAFKLNGFNFKKPFIEGKIVDDINFDAKERTNILIWDRDANNIRSVPSTNIGRTALTQLRQNGNNYRIVQLSPTGEESLRGIPSIQGRLPDGQISYVVTRDDPISGPLDFRQIPYLPGGHVSYRDGFFIRQPNVRTSRYGGDEQSVYYGDRNLLHFTTAAQARFFLPRIEEARQMLARGDNNALRAFLQQGNLPYSYQDFTGMFDPARGGIFDLNTPFYYSRQGSRTVDEHNIAANYTNFVKKSDSEFNLYNDVNLKYATERGETLNTIVERGSANSPWFSLEASQLLDPRATLNNSAASLLRGRYYDDLKYKAAEEFTAEFGDILDLTREELRNPVHALFNAPFKSNIQDKNRLAAAKNFRRSTKELLGTKSEFDKTLDWIHQSVADRIYGTAGDGRLLNTWQMMATSNPTRFLRSAAFHAKLGFFNPVQLFLQSQTFTHIMGLEGPARALKAAAAAKISDVNALNSTVEVTQALAQKAASMGWKPREFIEANNALARTGFANIGGEVAYLDDILSPDISKTGSVFSAAKEFSTVFFNKGERGIRKTAFFAAYDAWRSANPRLTLNDRAIESILARADDLSLNMTRASNSTWQHGPAAIPTQFFAYQARLMEQFMGNKLSFMDKSRLFATYSLMYGVPVGGIGSMTGALWPVHEEIKKGLLERGIDSNDDVISSVVDKGIVQTLWRMTGEEDHNFAERFGPGGLSWLKDLLTGDKGTFETIAGVAGSVWGDALLKAEPIATGLVTLLTEDDEYWPLLQSDIVEAASIISTINNANKAISSAMFGKYISKNGVVMHDNVDGWDAAFNFLSGTQPQSVSDFWSKVESLGDLKKHKQAVKKEVVKYMRMGYRAPTVEDSAKYFRKAKSLYIAGGFTIQEAADLNREAVKGFESQILDMGPRFSMQFPEARDAWIKEVKRLENKTNGND